MTRAVLLAALVAVAGCEDAPPADPPLGDLVVADSGLARPLGRGTVYPGELAAGDSVLASGEFADEVRFAARRGQRVSVELEATDDLDTYVILRSPAGVQTENDDAGENTRSSVAAVADTSGTWRAIATSYEAGQTGPYTLTIGVE